LLWVVFRRRRRRRRWRRSRRWSWVVGSFGVASGCRERVSVQVSNSFCLERRSFLSLEETNVIFLR
jgi:hypothetical protein